MSIPNKTPTNTSRGADRRRRPTFGKLAAAGAVALIAGGGAVGIAAARDEAPEPAPEDPRPGEVVDVVDNGFAGLEVPLPTEEDLRIQDEFDQCLTDNGVPPSEPPEPLADGVEAPEPAPIDIDDEVLDVCMPILENLSTWNWLNGGDEMPVPELVEIRDGTTP